MEKDHSVKEFFYDISFTDYPIVPSIDYSQTFWFPPHDPNGPRPVIEMIDDVDFRRMINQERRRFTIPVGDLTPEEAEEVIRIFARRFRATDPREMLDVQRLQMQGRALRDGIVTEARYVHQEQNIIDPIWVP